jgi:hypothetical protein
MRNGFVSALNNVKAHWAHAKCLHSIEACSSRFGSERRIVGQSQVFSKVINRKVGGRRGPGSREHIPGTMGPFCICVGVEWTKNLRPCKLNLSVYTLPPSMSRLSRQCGIL